MEIPFLLLRIQIPEEYLINARQITIEMLMEHLQAKPAVIFNFYAQAYGVEVKDYKYLPNGGFFVDFETRHCTHYAEIKGIERRDRLFSEKIYQPLVPPIYRESWFDKKDAIRSYAIIITKIIPLSHPIPIEDFLLYESNGNVSPFDDLHHPRPVLPPEYWQKETMSLM